MALFSAPPGPNGLAAYLAGYLGHGRPVLRGSISCLTSRGIDNRHTGCLERSRVTRRHQRNSRAETIEKLARYALRWKIATFPKILKSGCQTERSQPRTAERLVNLLALFCIPSWRIFRLTIFNCVAESARPFARLSGTLDQARDRPPGRIVIWRGLSRLADIAFG